MNLTMALSRKNKSVELISEQAFLPVVNLIKVKRHEF